MKVVVSGPSEAKEKENSSMGWSSLAATEDLGLEDSQDAHGMGGYHEDDGMVEEVQNSNPLTETRVEICSAGSCTRLAVGIKAIVITDGCGIGSCPMRSRCD